jgi:4'-phosphopantetheinyl transferase
MLCFAPETGSSLTAWPTPSDKVTLGPGEVQIWRASLRGQPTIVSRLWRILSADEQVRADHFHFEIDRRRFIVGRGWLRTILSQYLGVESAAIRFAYGEHGKPTVANSIGSDQQLKFNLAHSADVAFFGFTRIGEIGVDIEYLRPDFAGDDIASRFFSRAEATCLRELPLPERPKAFFDCWTRKEAFVKAKELGLSLALDQFEVTLSPEVPAALLRTRWDEDEASRWSLKAVDVEPGYVAAIAVEGDNCQVAQWQSSEKYLELLGD